MEVSNINVQYEVKIHVLFFFNEMVQLNIFFRSAHNKTRRFGNYKDEQTDWYRREG